MIRFLLIVFALVYGTETGEDGSGTLLIVRLTGFSSMRGAARVALFDSGEFWPEDIDNAVRRISASVGADTVFMTIKDLDPGEYAISAFHDEDLDSIFDRGLFGVPTEDYGFSNNVRGSTGPPPFEDALFTVGQDTLVLDIVLE